MSKKQKPVTPNIRIERIKKLMEEQDVNNLDLASKVGVTDVTISRWLNYYNEPTPENLKRIADALNTTTDYLNGYPGAYKSKADKEQEDNEYFLVFGEELAFDDPEEESRIKNQRRRRIVRNGFFLREIGYSYRENPGKDFGPPFCTLQDQHGKEYDFSYEEFEQLMLQIKDAVDFACFKKQKTVRDCGGMQSIDPLERR